MEQRRRPQHQHEEGTGSQDPAQRAEIRDLGQHGEHRGAGGDHDDRAQTEADGDDADIPERAAVLDLVGDVEGTDQARERAGEGEHGSERGDGSDPRAPFGEELVHRVTERRRVGERVGDELLHLPFEPFGERCADHRFERAERADQSEDGGGDRHQRPEGDRRRQVADPVVAVLVDDVLGQPPQPGRQGPRAERWPGGVNGGIHERWVEGRPTR